MPGPAAIPPTAPKAARPARTKAPASAAPAKAAPAKPSTARRAAPARASVATTTLTLSSRNYSSWSLRGWLLARFAGVPFTEVMVSPDDADARRELLLLSPSIRVPCLTEDGAKIWNTFAIAMYLHETRPEAGLLPADRIERAHCLSICGEMNAGFANLRSALPMNLKARFAAHRVWTGAQPDIDRIVDIWTDCIDRYGGPFLFGAKRTMADAMFAPVATRFLTYDVALPAPCAAYCGAIVAMPEMNEWITAARLEPDEIEELDMDF